MQVKFRDYISSKKINKRFLLMLFCGLVILLILFFSNYPPVGTATSTTPIRVTVKKDGTGNFTTLKAAMNSITDATASKPYEIVVYPGIYQETNIITKNYVNIRGVDKDKTWIKGELPPTATDDQMKSTQTILFNSTGTISNIKITAKNMRYPIHIDAGAQGNKNATQNIIDSYIEHYGNQEVIDYRKSHGLPAGHPWNAEHAVGIGTSDGMVINAINTTFKSRSDTFYFHTNANFDKPNRIELDNCRIIATNDSGSAIFVQALGSHRNDRLIINNSEINGMIGYNDKPWLDTSLAGQVADHAEIQIVGGGNTLVPFNIRNTGRALQITSNSTTGTSKVAVAGTAVQKIFGSVTAWNGAGGLKGYARGSVDVSGTALSASKLGQRLGNLTKTPLTLTVKVDALAPVTITFNKDYRTMDNNIILATINTALRSSAVASLYDSSWDHFPEFADEIVYVKNSSGTGIQRGMGVSYHYNFKTVRKAKQTDSASDFLGIAMADMRPNDWGPVKVRGYINDAFVRYSTAYAASAFGNKYGIGATDGLFVKNAQTTLLQGMGVNNLRFKI